MTEEKKCKLVSGYTIQKDGSCKRYPYCRIQGRQGCLASGAPKHKESGFMKQVKGR
jgi:hypothetical protein